MVVLQCSASQEERVDILNTALIAKGVVASRNHHEPRQVSVADAQQQPTPQPDTLMGEDNEEGVVL